MALNPVVIFSEYAILNSTLKIPINRLPEADSPPADFIFAPSRNDNSYTHPDLLLFSHRGAIH